MRVHQTVGIVQTDDIEALFREFRTRGLRTQATRMPLRKFTKSQLIRAGGRARALRDSRHSRN
jgi:hypothetical protein